jgi:hypothetical protein
MRPARIFLYEHCAKARHCYAAESGRTNGVSGRGIAGSLVDVAVLHQEPKPLAELSRDLTRFLVVDMLCSAKRLLPR